VYVVWSPESTTTEVVGPAEPESVASPSPNPDTGSENTTVNLTHWPCVGSGWSSAWLMLTGMEPAGVLPAANCAP
jgi:hypothetical protein